MKPSEVSQFMNFSDYARQSLTERFEGCRLQAYQDQAGVWTIGYGHTAHVYRGQVCTQQEADAWLAQDITIAENAVNRLVTVKLTQGEFDALVDFTFNLGVARLANSTLLDDLNHGNYEAAANEFEKWVYAGGTVVAGLLKRRQAEKERFQQVT